MSRTKCGNKHLLLSGAQQCDETGSRDSLAIHPGMPTKAAPSFVPPVADSVLRRRPRERRAETIDAAVDKPVRRSDGESRTKCGSELGREVVFFF